ncbi:nuclear transport factor 2 family protein [Piscinibacter koreensis]|uniref:Nuclear transport factor 2 family protein n=1 Tax=Piscinibacter koreensis TaxID=2742824 RepID=A0A7Y6NJ93_9BURK|nr:nuclear transport factor 2 family protein [Schlegelella koreensis]NUZ04201.1 nuclear transport factor 2 family protein [Schlegelella koreensis]
MTDPNAIASTYLRTWNETTPDARAALLRDAWSDDASYVDPLAAARGAAQIDALIGGVQARFPGFRFTLRGTPDGHGDHVRFGWSLGPDGVEAPIEGSDVLELKDGRIRRVVGFLDKVPAAA